MTSTSNNTALFMADAHIKSRTWTNNMQLYADAYTALLKVARHIRAMENPPKTLLIAGDWFDSNKPTSTDLMKSIDASRSYTISRTWRRYLQGVIPVEEESELLEA